MALRSSLFDDEYLPEFGTVVVRDYAGPDQSAEWPGWDERRREELDEAFSDALPGGSLVRTGAGWLQGNASDDWQRVRLEAHDSVPDVDQGWTAIAESPYLARSGFVELTSMTGGGGTEHLALGVGPGLYRVRVSRREELDGSSWLMQWWGDARPITSPRHLKIRRDTASPGASDISYVVADLSAIAAWVPDVVHSLDSLAVLLQVDLDALEDALRLASERKILAVERPATGTYVLRLLPGKSVREQRERQAALDVRRNGMQARQDAVRRLQVQTSPDGPVRPRTDTNSSTGARVYAVVSTSGSAPLRRSELLPTGDPLRFGGVSSRGLVVASADGAPEVLADLQAQHVHGAYATKAGILVLTSPRPVFVSWSGEVQTVSEELVIRVMVDGDGETVAFVESHGGRKSWERLQILDVASGARRTVDAGDSDRWALMGLSRGVVWVGQGNRTYLHHADGHVDELPYPVRTVDPVSGAHMVAIDGMSGIYDVRGDRPERQVDLTGTAYSPSLSPGGRWVFSGRYQPRQIITVDLIADAGPVASDLPSESRMEDVGPLTPFWEDAEHVFVQLDHSMAGHIGLRLNVRTRELVGVPSPDNLGYRPAMIRPYGST